MSDMNQRNEKNVRKKTAETLIVKWTNRKETDKMETKVIRTHSSYLLFNLLKGLKKETNDFTALDSHFTARGVRCVMRDEYDGQEYEIIVQKDGE